MRKITEIIIHCSATIEGKDYTVADIPYRRNWYLYIRDHLPHTELINEGTWIHVAL